MGKKVKVVEKVVTKKRKTAPSKSGDEPKSKKKVKLEKDDGDMEVVITTPTIVATTPTLLTMKELTERVKLSESMLIVAMELLDKSNPLTLIDIVCPNDKIRALNHAEIEAHRAEFTKKKTQKTSDAKTAKKVVYKDDEIRKFIVEKADKALQNAGVRIAGSTQHEKMDNTQKDKTLVSDFLGYAQTTKGYFVYVYFVGDNGNSATELANPKNWIPVHKSHLSCFHKRIRLHTPYHTHTKFDQTSYRGSVTPEYDPRFIMDTWLRKGGNLFKPLLREHKSLFEQETDFLIKHYETAANTVTEASSTLYYYDETKPDTITLDLTTATTDEMADIKVEPGSTVKKPARFNVAQDRLKQADCGFRYTDKELCHVTIEEFPDLSRKPLPAEIDLSWEEFAKLAPCVYVDDKHPMAPECYTHDPFVIVKAAIMALNMEMQIRRVPAVLGDEKLQILEADNMTPILDYMGSDTDCTDAIKKSTFSCLLSLMATELTTREEPPHIRKIFEERQGELSFVPLDY